MEADWAVEIGPETPFIVVPWDGFIDLRQNTWTTVQKISEAASYPSLSYALIELNSRESPVFTSKCDVWPLEAAKIDQDEFGARPENAQSGFASYIDVVVCNPDQFGSFDRHELLMRRATDNLRTISLDSCRIDLVLRPATVHSVHGFGITIYAAGCGRDDVAAYASWEAVLRAAVNATMKMAHFSHKGE